MKVKDDCISIIIPVFNGASFIESAYKNILNQNLKDFELIFVDNNSSDHSVAIIQAIVDKDDRVLFYTETKQGAAAARNKGLTAAKGEFIHFFDVDDQLFDGALLALKKPLQTQPKINSIYGKTIRVSSRIDDLSISSENTNKVHLKDKPHLGLYWLINKNKLPNVASFLHRKSVFDKISGFQEDLLLGEDAFFHVRLGNECDLAFLDRDILRYFRHPNSTVSIENRKTNHKVFTYWTQSIRAYIPYCLGDVSREFRSEVYKQVFWSIGKMLVLTDGYKNRKLIKKQCEAEISTIYFPFLLRIAVSLIVLTGNNNLFKGYVYYLVTPYFNYIFKGKKG